MHEVILIVDDDHPIRVLLVRLLRRQGYLVLQAATTNEALAALNGDETDLVISDIELSGESGIELRKVIAERWPNLPVILLSGYSAEEPAEFAARTPRTLFVQRPFVAEHFLSLVALTLRLST